MRLVRFALPLFFLNLSPAALMNILRCPGKDVWARSKNSYKNRMLSRRFSISCCVTSVGPNLRMTSDAPAIVRHSAQNAIWCRHTCSCKNLRTLRCDGIVPPIEDELLTFVRSFWTASSLAQVFMVRSIGSRSASTNFLKLVFIGVEHGVLWPLDFTLSGNNALLNVFYCKVSKSHFVVVNYVNRKT